MPPRPFPLPVGIGTDVMHVSRIVKLVGSSAEPNRVKLQQFLNRFLTYREQRDFRTRYRVELASNASLTTQAARYLAGRWAAKEAVIKAVHPRRLMLMDIEILKYPITEQIKGVFALIRDGPGSPKTPDRIPLTEPSNTEDEAVFVASESAHHGDGGTHGDISHENAAVHQSLDYDELEGQIAKVSISHDGEYATAVCLAANEVMAGDVGGETAARMP